MTRTSPRTGPPARTSRSSGTCGVHPFLEACPLGTATKKALATKKTPSPGASRAGEDGALARVRGLVAEPEARSPPGVAADGSVAVAEETYVPLVKPLAPVVEELPGTEVAEPQYEGETTPTIAQLSRRTAHPHEGAKIKFKTDVPECLKVVRVFKSHGHDVLHTDGEAVFHSDEAFDAIKSELNGVGCRCGRDQCAAFPQTDEARVPAGCTERGLPQVLVDEGSGLIVGQRLDRRGNGRRRVHAPGREHDARRRDHRAGHQAAAQRVPPLTSTRDE